MHFAALLVIAGIWLVIWIFSPSDSDLENEAEERLGGGCGIVFIVMIMILSMVSAIIFGQL